MHVRKGHKMVTAAGTRALTLPSRPDIAGYGTSMTLMELRSSMAL